MTFKIKIDKPASITIGNCFAAFSTLFLSFAMVAAIHGCKTSKSSAPADAPPPLTTRQIFDLKKNAGVTDSARSSKPIIAESIVFTEHHESAEILVQKSRLEIERGEYSSAEASLHEVLRKTPDYVPALVALANLEFRRGNYSNVTGHIEDARRSLTRQENPDEDTQISIEYLNAVSYLGLGQIERGRNLLADLIAIKPEFTPAYSALANSYLIFRQWHVVEKIVNSGLERVGDQAPLLTLKAAVMRQRQNDLDAERLLLKALKIDENYLPALTRIAQLQLDQGKIDEAEANINHALNRNALDPDAYIAKGILEKYQGKPKLAEASLLQAIKLSPKSYLARYHLGLLYKSVLNDASSAMRLFNEARFLAPKGSEVNQACQWQLDSIQR